MAGGSRSQVNKSHKTRFASKSSRNLHKTSTKDKSKISKPDRNVVKGARAARLQRNKMMREQKRATLLKEKRASSGTTSAPRVIVLFGLSASTNVSSLAGDLLALLSNQNRGIHFPAVASSEYRLRAMVLQAPHGDLMACMEMAKMADLMVFVASLTVHASTVVPIVTSINLALSVSRCLDLLVYLVLLFFFVICHLI